jgi:hypothetical protein
MKFREWVGLQKEMVQEVSGILAIMLLTVNVGLSIFLLVREQGGLAASAYVVVPMVAVALGLVVWVSAYAWHFVGKMHYAKQRALATLNPYMTTDFTPHEWVLWHDINLPWLRGQRELVARAGADTKELDESIARLERWLAQGRIPKDEFPSLMRRFLRAS